MGMLAPCARCERVREIVARGLCNSCYISWKRWMNPDAHAAYSNRYRETHREQIREYQREWHRRRKDELSFQELEKDTFAGDQGCSNPPPVNNDLEAPEIAASSEVARGAFTIAVESEHGRGWIVGRFKYLVPDEEDLDM